MFEMVKLIAPRSSTVLKRNRFDPRALQESVDPFINWNVQIDAASVDECCNLPCGDGTDANSSAMLPAGIDPRVGFRTQAVIAGIEPENDMGVEQQSIGHRSISWPVSASGTTSRTDATKSTSPRTWTDPG